MCAEPPSTAAQNAVGEQLTAHRGTPEVGYVAGILGLDRHDLIHRSCHAGALTVSSGPLPSAQCTRYYPGVTKLQPVAAAPAPR